MIDMHAWAERVRANRDQVEHFKEADPTDFYAPVAGLFRADPHRTDEPALEALRALIRPDDVVLDIGAGGGRYALPLALIARQVIAIDPSEGMLSVLRQGMADARIDNIQVVRGRWPADARDLSGDVALIAHLGYDVEDIGPFLDGMERAARRLCIAMLLEQPPPTEADRLWPAVHGVERAALPALPEFLDLLQARGNTYHVTMVERASQSYEQPDQTLAWLRQQLWTRPDSAKDRLLQRTMRDRLQERDGRFALSWEPVRVGLVTWSGTNAAPPDD
jgi:ubiquinone/menaquinone biosynthesis C-methylase UbiE